MSFLSMRATHLLPTPYSSPRSSDCSSYSFRRQTDSLQHGGLSFSHSPAGPTRGPTMSDSPSPLNWHALSHLFTFANAIPCASSHVRLHFTHSFNKCYWASTLCQTRRKNKNWKRKDPHPMEFHIITCSFPSAATTSVLCNTMIVWQGVIYLPNQNSSESKRKAVNRCYRPAGVDHHYPWQTGMRLPNYTMHHCSLASPASLRTSCMRHSARTRDTGGKQNCWLR